VQQVIERLRSWGGEVSREIAGREEKVYFSLAAGAAALAIAVEDFFRRQRLCDQGQSGGMRGSAPPPDAHSAP